MWNPVATRLQPFIKAMAHVDGIAATECAPAAVAALQTDGRHNRPFARLRLFRLRGAKRTRAGNRLQSRLANPRFSARQLAKMSQSLIFKVPAGNLRGRVVDGLTAVSGTA